MINPLLIKLIGKPALAGIVSYFVANHYYIKGHSDINQIKRNLERLTLELLDIEAIETGDIFGWRVCPECESDNIESSSYMDNEKDKTYFMIRCKGCGNSEFNSTSNKNTG